MKILIYHGKHGDQYWLADTTKRLEAAQQALFQQLDKAGFYYCEDQDTLDAAREGNKRAIRGILESRRCYEYEEWEIVEVEVLSDQGKHGIVIREGWDTKLPSIPGHPDLLSFDIYQRAAYATAIYPREKVIDYPTLGLAGEAGETANKVKKIYRDDGGVLTADRRQQISKELGGVLWYVAALATDLGLSLTDIAAQNLDILNDRQRRGVVSGSGDDR